MPINEATIAKARLYPELLPDACVVNMLAGVEVSLPVLDLRRFAPKILHLKEISLEQNALVDVRTRADDLRHETNTAGFQDQMAGVWELVGTEYLKLNFFATNVVNNYRTHYSLWVYDATVAHLLKHKKKLTPEQERIAKDLKIADTVEKGILPLPLSYQIEREYHVLDESTYTRTFSLTAGIETAVEAIAPRMGEFLVLTKISSAPGLVTDGIRIRIDRDDDVDYLELYTYPMALTKDINCFVPALKELRVKAVAVSNVASHTIRFTVRRVLMTNILRVRFGLMARDEAPGDLWDKVKGGVL